MLVDTHCHLDFNSFDADRLEVIYRARQAGVERILNPGIDVNSSQTALALADLYPEVYAAVGVHPNSALTWEKDSLDHLRAMAVHPKVVAIGEIGLDYYRDRSPQDHQKLVFSAQLNLAGELGLPVVIHNRLATDDMLKILFDWCSGLVAIQSELIRRPGVLHSYSDAEEPARRAVELNFFIGFTGPVTFLNAKALQHVVRSVPLDHVLFETDAPFLTPHPHRGKRNEPAYVRLVAEKVAEINHRSFSEASDITTANAARLFHW